MEMIVITRLIMYIYIASSTSGCKSAASISGETIFRAFIMKNRETALRNDRHCVCEIKRKTKRTKLAKNIRGYPRTISRIASDIQLSSANKR